MFIVVIHECVCYLVMVMIVDKGMQKINFSGGEPFIHQKGKFVGELVRYCKEDLELPSVTIVSNGSLITEEWFQDYGKEILDYCCMMPCNFKGAAMPLYAIWHSKVC